ncbi:MAG: TFIIB-type zinc finger domain-containing protein [Thermoplasmataceae archaeon]
MESGAPTQSKYTASIMDRLIYILGGVFVSLGIITFFYLIPFTLNEAPIIESLPTSYYLIFSTKVSYLTVIVITLILVILGFLSIYSLLLGGLGTKNQQDANQKYSGLRYLSVYILVELIISEIVSYEVPGISHQFPLNQPFGVQNFILSVSNLFGTAIEFVIITLALMADRAISHSARGSALFGPYLPAGRAVAISVIVSIVMVGLSPSNFVLDFTSFLSYFVIGMVIIRFGFLKAFAVTFSSTSVDILSYVISGYPVMESALTILLFIIAFFGLFSASEIAFRAARVQQKREETAIQQRQEETDLHLNDKLIQSLFVRSTCPVCGNYSFYVESDLSLKCTRCGHVIASDAMAQPNISVQILRSRRPF